MIFIGGISPLNDDAMYQVSHWECSVLIPDTGPGMLNNMNEPVIIQAGTYRDSV